MRMVAALYVQRRGVYVGLAGVDPWPEERDARTYAGPHPVVAHPPCARWGRYWSGGPSHAGRFQKGDDGGCFSAALEAVRRWGGVLEHPADSSAWLAHGLIGPPRSGGWVTAGDWLGWTCCVEQGHYGHPSRKPTWLYVVGCDLPSLPWGRSGAGARLDLSARTTEERRRLVRSGVVPLLCARKRSATPGAFASLLLSIARTARVSSCIAP